VRRSGVDGRDERHAGEKKMVGGRWLPFKGAVRDSRGGGGFRQWRADAADTQAPAGGGRGSEERGAGACGPA
jgi:hypothetical protein